MLRLYAHDTAGWRALPHSDGLHALENKVQETAKLHNACVCVDESLVVCEPYSIVCVYVSSTTGCQREHVMCEEHDVYFAPVQGGLLVRTTNALYEHLGAHEQPVTSVYAKPGLRRCEQARARQFKAAAKPFRVRIFRFVVFVRGNVSRVALSCRPKKRLVQPVARPVCVNVCYTTTVHGSIPHVDNLALLTESTKHGACGSVHTTSTIFGVLEIFPKQHGMRKVIGKGYQCATDMQHDVRWLCRVIGTSEVGTMQMHMCILKASTGTRLDIAVNGFLHRYLSRRLCDAAGCVCRFRAAVPELDVHCIVEVEDMSRLLACGVVPGVRADEHESRALGNLSLFLSCTGLGVCIYRVARRQYHADSCPIALERRVMQQARALHALICTFPEA